MTGTHVGRVDEQFGFFETAYRAEIDVLFE